MPLRQELLHKLEAGGGLRYFRVGLAVLLGVVLIGGYDLRAYRNMGTQEAMDAAQLARNIAQGKGYTTLFIRPFSIHLVKERNKEGQGAPAVAKLPIWPNSGACIPTSPIRRFIRSCWPG